MLVFIVGFPPTKSSYPQSPNTNQIMSEFKSCDVTFPALGKRVVPSRFPWYFPDRTNERYGMKKREKRPGKPKFKLLIPNVETADFRYTKAAREFNSCCCCCCVKKLLANNCERSELLICKVHQFGLGCIKNCAHWPIRIPFRDFFVSFWGGQIRYFFNLIFGNSLFISARRMNTGFCA